MAAYSKQLFNSGYKDQGKRGFGGRPHTGICGDDSFLFRPSSLFEKKDQSSACNADDQTGCYQLECLVKLNTESVDPVTGVSTPHTGADGVAVGDCELETCTGGFGVQVQGDAGL